MALSFSFFLNLRRHGARSFLMTMFVPLGLWADLYMSSLCCDFPRFTKGGHAASPFGGSGMLPLHILHLPMHDPFSSFLCRIS